MVGMEAAVGAADVVVEEVTVGPPRKELLNSVSIMGLQMLGIVNINFPSLTQLFGKRKGYWGSFLVGMSFGLVASPCATPVLAVLLTYVAGSGRLWYGGVLLFIYGLGHGLPLLIVGTFTSLLKQLPRWLRWSSYVTYFSGVVMIALGLYFLYRTTLYL